eukprot:scaffold150207_cov19-Tisochrysis_lutea.AAC.1
MVAPAALRAMHHCACSTAAYRCACDSRPALNVGGLNSSWPVYVLPSGHVHCRLPGTARADERWPCTHHSSARFRVSSPGHIYCRLPGTAGTA